MNTENYPSNSKLSKTDGKNADPAEKKVEKVVTGSANIRRKSETRKLLDIFIPEDITNVREFIFQDVIVPGIKRMIYDMGLNALDGFFGEFSRGSKLGKGANIAYNAISSKMKNPRRYDAPVQRGTDYDEVILSSRAEAQRVIDGIEDIIDRYGVASIQDLYELAGLEAPYTYNKYGWTDVSPARIITVREGYLVKMPRAMPLD